jgi:hypothetical protein
MSRGGFSQRSPLAGSRRPISSTVALARAQVRTSWMMRRSGVA